MADMWILLIFVPCWLSGFFAGRWWQIQVHRRRMRPLLARADEAQERLQRLVLVHGNTFTGEQTGVPSVDP